MGAIDDQRQLTALGRQLSRLPLDAIHGRMVLEGQRRGALAEVLVLVAALSISEVRERPLEHQQAADQAHQAFAVAGSDFLSTLKLWQWWQQLRQSQSRAQAQRTARASYLSVHRLHEWMQLHSQLLQIARDQGWSVGQLGQAEPEAIHRSVLAGLLGRIGQHHEQGVYVGARGHKFYLFPGSVLAKQQPAWVMAAELVETGRSYARMVTSVAPKWLESQASHLLRRQVFDPYWDRRSGRVMGFERLTLHGLTVVERRRLHYGPHDPVVARQLFIRHALVQGEMQANPRFMRDNLALIAELAEHEHKRRRRDVLASDQAMARFFEERLPKHLYSTKAFLDWYGALDEAEQQQLLFDRATLLRDESGLAADQAYPDALRIGPESFPLSYHFEPGSPHDGITLHCPLHLLARVDGDQLQWLVPGMLEEKVVALIQSLPKSKRRALLPVAEFARAAVASLQDVDEAKRGGLLNQLAIELSRISGLAIEVGDFQLEKLAPHWFIRIEVMDEAGRVLGCSRDLSALMAQFAERARQEFMARQAEQWHQDGLDPARWPPLPQCITTRGGHQAWPALQIQGERVGIRLFDDEDSAAACHHEALLALVKKGLSDLWKGLRKNPGIGREAQLAWTRVEDMAEVAQALRRMVLSQLLPREAAWQLRDPAAVKAKTDALRSPLSPTYLALAQHCNDALIQWHVIDRRLSGLASAAPRNIADLRSQLDDLMFAGFLDHIDAQRLAHYPRYLKAMLQRLDQLERDPRRDAERMAEVQPWWQAYLDHLANQGWYSENLDQFRWLIEEYRVQCFAQSLGTAEKVSVKRLRAAAEAAELAVPDGR